MYHASMLARRNCLADVAQRSAQEKQGVLAGSMEQVVELLRHLLGLGGEAPMGV